MLTPTQLTFLNHQRVARLATADKAGVPHIVPICYVVEGASVYIALDAKPKRVAPLRLKRVRNIAENAEVSVLVDSLRRGLDHAGLGAVRRACQAHRPGPGACRCPSPPAPALRAVRVDAPG